MAFRKRREARYTRLRDIGFLPFEARTISSVSRKTPYLSQMMATRASLLAKTRKEGWSKVRYNTYIKERYRAKGWQKRNRAGNLIYDPWQMWRAYEDRYKSKHPEYESPWVKKQQKWQRFTSKYDKGLEKYDRGRGR